MAEQDPVVEPATDTGDTGMTALHEPDRMVFFSDAVVAIAMTLLALELPVPGGDSAGAVVQELRDHLAQYGAFLCSFFVIGGAWSAHHQLLGFVRRIDARAIGLNLRWLFLIVLTPFATKFMTEGSGTSSSLRLACYAFVQVLTWSAMLRLYFYLRRHQQLADDTGALRDWVRRRFVFVVFFAVSVPMAFLSPWAAGGCWAASPLCLRGLRMVSAHRKRRVTQAGQ